MDLSDVSSYIIEGKADEAESWTRKALDEGIEPTVIVNQGLIPGMDVVGEKFENREYYMPEMLVAAKAMKRSMDLLRPLLTEAERSSEYKVVCGTVQGDLHDIGVSLVAMMLEGAGFDVKFVGVDNTPDMLLKAVEEHDAQVLCISALLTTTIKNMRKTIDLATQMEMRNRVLIYVGGAPVTQEFADEIGADGYKRDAGSAARMIKEDLDNKVKA